jgi:hypothetical protein
MHKLGVSSWVELAHMDSKHRTVLHSLSVAGEDGIPLGHELITLMSRTLRLNCPGRMAMTTCLERNPLE